jgi:hypothetical protein
VISLGDLMNVNPYICIGIISIVGPIGCLLIKETLRMPLEDEIEEEKKKNNVSKLQTD